MARKKQKPSDPMAIMAARAERRQAARDPANWGPNREALGLSVNDNVTTIRGERGQPTRIHRADVWSMLHTRGALSQEDEQAVRKLQTDVAILHQTRGSPEFFYMPGSGQPGRAFERRMEAGERIAAAKAAVGPVSWWLLEELAVNPAVLPAQVDWKDIASKITGEFNDRALGALVRCAATNLAIHYRTSSIREAA